MKIPITLLILSVGLAFGAGYLALQVQKNDAPSFTFSTSEIGSVKRAFREKNPVVSELNAAELFPLQADLELLAPGNILNAVKGRRFSQTASIFRAIKQCKPELIKDRDLGKAREWIAFQCQKISRLSKGFFAKPPFLFPLGDSFAALAYALGNPEFRSEDWLKDHIQQFNALELKYLPAGIITDSRRRILSSFDPDTLLLLSTGQSWIVAPQYVLVRRTAEVNGDFVQHPQPAVDYLVYNRTDWNGFLMSHGIEASSAASPVCLYRADGLCWNRAPASSVEKIRWSVGALFLFAIILIGFCVMQIIKTIRDHKLEDEKKRFALRSLTHELRTPLASLVISSEHLMRQFAVLPSSTQEAFLRIFDDVQRLTRVAETSRHYLSAGASKEIVPLDLVMVSSVNGFVESVLERYIEEITLTKLDTDSALKMDKYWLGICLQNLVRNALQHGRKPITVALKKSGSSLVFSVSDSGDIPDGQQKSLFRPFSKRNGSPGLGLGLAIVETVAKAMDSKLKVSFRPTNFELWIEGGS